MYIHYQQVYLPWALSLMTAYLVRGLPAYRVESACALHLPLPWEPGYHPGWPTILIVAAVEHLAWALGRLTRQMALQPPASYAVLISAEPRMPQLTLPGPLQTYQYGPLWLLAGRGMPHR